MQLHQYLDEHNKSKIIFDFDKTLFDLHLPWKTFKNNMLLKLRTIDQGLILEQEADPIIPLMNQAIKKHGMIAKSCINTFCRDFEQEHASSESPNMSLVMQIKELDSNYKKYIWSSNMYTTVKHVLDLYKLNTLFSLIVTQDLVEYLKPEPDGFHQIFQSEGGSNEEYILIGDSRHDEGASKAAGIDFLHVAEISD